MNKHSHLLAIFATIVSSALGGALAQSSDHAIDPQAIRERAADLSNDAELIASLARARAGAVANDAIESAEAGKASGRHYAVTLPRPKVGDTAFDFDRMVADAGDMARDSLGEAPRFIAFASLSMPGQALRQMMDDVTHAGGVVVFRGLNQGSAKIMTEALGKVLKPGERVDGIGIDPRLFRAFGITEVPAYIVTASDFDLCSGFDCTSQVPPYDRINGNITAEYALRTIATGGGPGARIAAQHLARLQRDQP